MKKYIFTTLSSFIIIAFIWVSCATYDKSRRIKYSDQGRQIARSYVVFTSRPGTSSGDTSIAAIPWCFAYAKSAEAHGISEADWIFYNPEASDSGPFVNVIAQTNSSVSTKWSVVVSDDLSVNVLSFDDCMPIRKSASQPGSPQP